MIIPHEQLSDDALRGLMEEFITREGTDYGWETSLERKVEQVKAQIQRGDVVIVFDPATESVSLLTRQQAREAEQNIEKAGEQPDD
ncbi:YheU family protein [Marinimicrobium sp. C2-29]|uniref:YheU family protein n=1 Tax=Marinimicrobium sp. C2-29 TaxID=3139825 RepID=UPI003139FE20